MAKIFFNLGRFLDGAESKRIFSCGCLLSGRWYTRRSDADAGLRPSSYRPSRGGRSDGTKSTEVVVGNDFGRRQTKNLKAVINIRDSTHDDRFREIVERVKSHSKREKLGMSLIVGESLINEALRSGSSISEIFYCNQSSLQMLSSDSLDRQKVPLHRVSIDLFTKCMNTKLPTDGIMAVISLPLRKTCDTASRRPLPVTVICDNLRDPGNMGIIIQSAVATSCSRVLVTKGCVDVWEPKVLQMGCGAHFHASIQNCLDWKEIDSILAPETSLFLADSTGSKKTSPFSDNVTDSPLLSYDRVDYCSSPVAVVIGGETESVSQEAFQFCRSRQHLSHRVHIPMMKSVNSLNSAIAGSVILFEIARQLKLRRQREALSPVGHNAVPL